MNIRQALGWQHRGFRVASHGKATLGLCLILALPFIVDQLAFLDRMHNHNPDLKGWRETAARVVADPSKPLYGHDRGFYIYPPFFLTLIWPLSQVSESLAAVLFETAKWIAIFVSLRVAWRLCSPPGEDLPPIVALGSLVLTGRFLWNDLGVGNVNVFILLAVLIGCRLVATGWPFAAGAIVAVAVSVKVTPALLLVYFLYKGWWRTLLGAAGGAAVCFLIWPALWFGWENNWHLLSAWYDMVVASFVERGEVYSIHTNQSLVGILNRLLGPSVAIQPDTHLAIAVLPQWGRDAIRYVVAAAVLLGLAVVCRGRTRPREQPLLFGSEVGLVLIAMLLLSGLSWKAHFVTMLLPYTVLLAYLADARHAPRPRKLGWLLLASFALCTLTADIITPAGADFAEALGLIQLGALLAGCGLVLLRIREFAARAIAL